MKIGILLISSGFAGLERAVYSLVNNLKQKNDVLLFLNDDIVEFYKDIQGIKVFSLGKYSTKNLFAIQFSLLKLKNNLFNYLKAEQLDVLHIQSSVSMAVYSFITGKLNIPVISTFHGTDINNFINKKNPLYTLAVKPKIKKVLEHSQKITSVSNHQIRDLPGKYKSMTVVIPNGVDSAIFKPIKNIKQEENVILFAGRFIEIKGIREIISVVKQLSQYEFWFAGKGELDYFINLANTKNLGSQPTKELVKLYNQAEICIFPSYREGFPLCGLEAMSCGRAVIATPLGFSEYIEDGKDGIIIPAKDEDALKNAIVDLITNEKKRKMLEKNARKKALQYSWDKVSNQYLEVYLEVVRK
jgi:glycosyltransferase involved in cell wall biosynthesis